jgi:acetylornithine deacetylase
VGAGEAAIAAWARDWLVAQGVSARLETVVPGRANVVAEVGSGDGRALVLCAHLDTVGVEGMTSPPFAPRVADGRLFGRGSYDMKGGVAAAMAATAAVAREGLAGRLLLALVVDEEVASLGASHFVAHHRADACIVTEPTEERLVLAHKGFVWLEVTTRGRAAHGSRWDLGESAIARMGAVIQALDHLDREVLRRRHGELVGPASLHCATVSGGTGWSTYSAECLLRVERRTLPGEDEGAVIAELGEVVSAADPRAELRTVLVRPPSRCDAGEPLVASIERGAAAAGLPPLAPAGVGYWMDAALFSAAGIPAVALGAAGEGAHAAEEWVDLASVVRNATLLAAVARDFCAART